ncbi:MAG: T9SS type A sorting domain-containing protein [Melioribacter sp.]|uniref:T9SS type A sorting domain-containing protein n=1 Tax=Rosettibacter primus TaxID=3111523 RepID=UPI00247C76F7|nr:T9SS type A sorting domain-containing protein [Melioribacter sp.]
MKTSYYNLQKIFFASTLFLIMVHICLFAQTKKDIVYGNLILFNDNGLWCWFQDERCIVDTINSKLILGSVANLNGFDGSSRSGLIEAVIFDIKTRLLNRYELGKLSNDDHNAPAFLIRPDGKYIAMFSDHYDKYKNRYRIFDGISWSPQLAYDWTKRPGGTDYTIAYNNLYYLSAEKRMYNFSRANHRSPNFIVSDDQGDTWTFGGQLTTNSSNSYNKGYYKYWSNGIDRIDFIFTEQHPRDTLTSIYHGYIKNGKAFKSDGTQVDDDIYDTTFIPAYWHFTKVFSNGTKIGNNTFYRCWQSDLMRYDDGTIAAIITARMNQSESFGYPDNNVNPEHAFIYCRYDGQKWSYTFLTKAGLKFYASEADYVGLGALSPNDPNTIYISTPYDPRDTTVKLNVREIFKGVTIDNGTTWSWEPITQNSTRDNIRPIVPSWNKDNVALLWCRGTYTSAQSYDAAVVGIIERKNEKISKKNYIDASIVNTFLEDGSPIVITGPDSNSGAADNKWHLRTGYGNNNTIFTSSEIRGENAPVIKTKITVPENGTYDIWVNFWANPSADWRIKSGLSLDNMQTYRHIACQSVDENDYEVPLTANQSNYFLYQAYVGRIVINDDLSFYIYIDDNAIRTGTTNTLTGDLTRTWYDGISYAKVDTNGTVDVEENNFIPKEFVLYQNYPNPFNPSTKITYELSKASFVTLKVYDVLGREVVTLINQHQNPGRHEAIFNASHLSSGVYFYTLNADNNFIATKKMILIR